jgi:hypothetical protein
MGEQWALTQLHPWGSNFAQRGEIKKWPVQCANFPASSDFGNSHALCTYMYIGMYVHVIICEHMYACT